jgi:N-acetylmuramoyl-L-alanine amidase
VRLKQAHWTLPAECYKIKNEGGESAPNSFAENDEALKTLIIPLRRHSRSVATIALASLLGLAGLFWWTRPLRSDNFVFYLPTTHDVIPIRTIGDTSYLPVVRILNLVGRVDALRESSDRLRLWYGETMLEVRAGNRKVTVNKISLTLSEPVRLVDGQWLVPADFLSLVLPRIVKEPVVYRSGDKRIFIGSTKPSTFTVHLGQIPEGARLRVEFTAPLTFQTASRDGKWILYLGNRVIEPLEQKFQFDNPYVSSLQFDDQDGVPKLILTPKAAGLDLLPTLEEGGETLRADVVKPGSSAAERTAGAEPAQSPAAAASASQGPGSPGGPALPSVSGLPLVVLDAGHGGADTGAQGQDGVVEKDLVAQYVVRVRTALLTTQKYRVILTRVGNADPDFDQRAIVADTARAAVFLSFHAGNLGFRTPRVAIYTYQPPEPSTFEAGPSGLRLVPWHEAQMLHLDQSKRLAQALQGQLANAFGTLPVSLEAAPVRVLRSVDAPAVAIEVGSLSPHLDATPLLDPEFQQRVSDAIVRALDVFTRRPS